MSTSLVPLYPIFGFFNAYPAWEICTALAQAVEGKDPWSILLAGFVPEYTLSFWGIREEPTRWYFTLLMNRHLSTAIGFNNLDNVTLKMCFLSPETFNALARMSSVGTMTFDTCSVLALEASSGTTCPPLVGWTRLSVTCTPFPPFWCNILGAIR